jgi:hypothetical protein
MAGILICCGVVQAQEDSQAAMKSDKTGTNPINFQYELRLYHEYRWLNTAVDGAQNVTTLEFRSPFAGGKWQFRAKVRGVGLDVGEVDEYGFGDMDLRVMTVPYMNMQKRRAIATGLEVFIDTASEDVLGSGATSLAPFIFVPYFNPIGAGSIFVPGYQHIFSVNVDDGRSDVHQGLIDMFLVKTFNGNQFWGYIDPQIMLDYENNIQYMLVEIQAGTMLGTKGQSAYILPSIGVGTDRPYDFSLEVGYKVIW